MEGIASVSRVAFTSCVQDLCLPSFRVKAQTCSMIYNHNGDDYLLHLVDTPGHVDFRAEVSRSYASCGGGKKPVEMLLFCPLIHS